MRDFVLELGELVLGRQLAVHQQVGDFEEARVLGQLLDRVAAVQQHACVAVDVGDRRLAAGGGGEARVVGEAAGFLRQLARCRCTAGRAPGAAPAGSTLLSPAVSVTWSGRFGHGSDTGTPRDRACRGRPADALGESETASRVPRRANYRIRRFGAATRTFGLATGCAYRPRRPEAAQTKTAALRRPSSRHAPLRHARITSARSACGTCRRGRWCP